MATYSVSISEAEDKALSYVAASQQDWIDNAVRERCRIASEEVIRISVEQCLATGTPVPQSKDEIILLAFEMGWVKTAAQRNADANQQFP